MTPRIHVHISGGKAVIKTSGFTGASCLQATLALERALGHKTGDTPTAEMRQPVAATQDVEVQS